MKKLNSYIILIVFSFFVFASLPACAPKYGCPSTENASVKMDKKGYPTKKGKSNLFPKEMRKKKKN